MCVLFQQVRLCCKQSDCILPLCLLNNAILYSNSSNCALWSLVRLNTIKADSQAQDQCMRSRPRKTSTPNALTACLWAGLPLLWEFSALAYSRSKYHVPWSCWCGELSLPWHMSMSKSGDRAMQWLPGGLLFLALLLLLFEFMGRPSIKL